MNRHNDAPPAHCPSAGYEIELGHEPGNRRSGLSREPFVPLRIHLTDGSSLDIHNPGLAFIAKLALYVARADRPHSRIMNDFRLVSLRHIVRIELLESAAA